MQLIKMKRHVIDLNEEKCNWFKWRGIVIVLNEEKM